MLRNIKQVFGIMIATILLLALTACGDNSGNQNIEDVYETLINETSSENEENHGDTYYSVDLDIESVLFLPNFSGGVILVDGVSLSGRLFTAEGETYPTHIQFLWDIVDILGWELIGAGSQTAIFRDGEHLAEVWYIGWREEFDVSIIGADDVFALFDIPGEGAYLESYWSLSLFRDMGYKAYYAGGIVYINAEHDASLPHPFATALGEYMAGYDGVVRAYLATLDDDGTMGVLTTRPTARVLVDYDTGEYRYGPSTTLFYMQDGELFQIDASGWLFVAGRYNRLMERLYTHTHIVELIYKLESGGLEISTQLEYFSDEYLSYLLDDYDAVSESIARRDALAEYAREKYGLIALPPPHVGHMRNTQDQTTQILAMTINCVPSLAH